MKLVRLGGVIVLGLVLAAGAAAREIQRVEAVGAVGVRDGSSASTSRDRAVQRALQEAVNRTALSLLAEMPMSGNGTGIELSSVLGADPMEYTSRFQVIEDRGEREPMFVTDPDVTSEYVVVVEVHVEVDLVRSRLQAAGLDLAPSGESSPKIHLRVGLEGIDDYRVFEAIQGAMTPATGVRSSVLLSAEPERLVLAVDSDRTPYQLVGALQRAVPPHIELDPIDVGSDSVTLRVRAGAPGAASLGEGPVRIDRTYILDKPTD